MAETKGGPKESVGDLSNLSSSKPEIPKEPKPNIVNRAVKKSAQKILGKEKAEKWGEKISGVSGKGKETGKKATRWAGAGWRHSGEKRWFSIIPITLVGTTAFLTWLFYDDAIALYNSWDISRKLGIEGLTNDETARLDSLLAGSENRAEYLLSGSGEIKTYLDN